VLVRYAQEWPLDIQDISAFVTEQRANVMSPFGRLATPREIVYPVAEPDVAARLGVA
jgi:hypothetical protein